MTKFKEEDISNGLIINLNIDHEKCIKIEVFKINDNLYSLHHYDEIGHIDITYFEGTYNKIIQYLEEFNTNIQGYVLIPQ